MLNFSAIVDFDALLKTESVKINFQCSDALTGRDLPFYQNMDGRTRIAFVCLFHIGK